MGIQLYGAVIQLAGIGIQQDIIVSQRDIGVIQLAGIVILQTTVANQQDDGVIHLTNDVIQLDNDNIQQNKGDSDQDIRDILQDNEDIFLNNVDILPDIGDCSERKLLFFTDFDYSHSLGTTRFIFASLKRQKTKDERRKIQR